MRYFKITLLAFLFFLSANKAGAGTRDPDTPDSAYIKFGSKFPGVVRLKASVPIARVDPEILKKAPPGSTIFKHASAVIIKPHWVVTAAHVIEDTDTQIITHADKEHTLTKIIPHPEYADDKTGYFDVALGYSPQLLELAFYTPLCVTDTEVGKQATIAGYGWHGTFHTGGKEYDGQRRAGSNMVSGSERHVLICDASTVGKTALEFLICPGDSGGGLFIGNELAGISSFLIAIDKKPNGTYGDKAAFTRVSLYADWVNLQMQAYEQHLALSRPATRHKP